MNSNKNTHKKNINNTDRNFNIFEDWEFARKWDILDPTICNGLHGPYKWNMDFSIETEKQIYNFLKDPSEATGLPIDNQYIITSNVEGAAYELANSLYGYYTYISNIILEINTDVWFTGEVVDKTLDKVIKNIDATLANSISSHILIINYTLVNTPTWTDYAHQSLFFRLLKVLKPYLHNTQLIIWIPKSDDELISKIRHIINYPTKEFKVSHSLAAKKKPVYSLEFKNKVKLYNEHLDDPIFRLKNLAGLKKVKNTLYKIHENLLKSDDRALDSYFNFIFSGEFEGSKFDIAEILAGIFHNAGFLPNKRVISVHADHIPDNIDTLFKYSHGNLILFNSVPFRDFDRIAYNFNKHKNDTIVVFCDTNNLFSKYLIQQTNLRKYIYKNLHFDKFTKADLFDIFLYICKKDGKFVSDKKTITEITKRIWNKYEDYAREPSPLQPSDLRIWYSKIKWKQEERLKNYFKQFPNHKFSDNVLGAIKYTDLFEFPPVNITDDEIRRNILKSRKEKNI